jgi:hypothetical protein
MLRSGLDLIAPSALSAAAALPALQLLRGGLQQRFASTTKKAKKPAAPAVQDAKKPKAKKEDKPAAKATSKDVIKRPPSAFNLYVKAHSGAISSGTAADRMKRLSQEWKTLSDTDKAPYQQQAAAAKSETAKVGNDCACSGVHAWHPDEGRKSPVGQALASTFRRHLLCSQQEHLAAERLNVVPGSLLQRISPPPVHSRHVPFVCHVLLLLLLLTRPGTRGC